MGRDDVAPLLVERLAPHWRRVIFTTAHTLGAVGRSLGRLHTLTGDYAAAETALQEALRVHERLQARYWIARTQLDLADLCAVRRAAGDAVLTTELVAEARHTSETYGLGGLRSHARFSVDD